MQATKLKINIRKEGDEFANLEFPIFTLNMIGTLIPEKAHEYLIKSSIDLESILKSVKESDYKPQTILEFDHNEKHFRIWIE